MITISDIKKEEFEIVVVSDDFDDFRREEVSIVYKNKMRLAFSIQQFTLLDENEKILQSGYFADLDCDFLARLNHEIVRAIHDVTSKSFRVKTDCKFKTLQRFLKNNDSQYLNKLLMILHYIHESFNLHGGDVSVYSINVN